LDLEREVEDRGMQLHAEAKREQFRIYATCLSQDVPKGLLLLLLQKLLVEFNRVIVIRRFIVISSSQNYVNSIAVNAVAVITFISPFPFNR